MIPTDPRALARFQIQRDRAATRGVKGLFEHKLERMSASPLAFLRGAAPLFYEILKSRPELAKGPPGKGWLTGDMHLENFGAYRPDHNAASERGGEPAPAVFDLNDFDDAIVGPFYFDVLRLTTSLILGGRELGANGVRVLKLCDLLLAAYVRALGGSKAGGALPPPIARLVEQVKDRPLVTLLNARTVGHGDGRRFEIGLRYKKLEPAIAKKVPAAFAKYVASLRDDERGDEPERFKVIDVARRIAGTGSLGSLRIAVLVQGKGGHDGQWVFDLKEQGAPSLSVLLGAPKLGPAERVVTAARACLEHPPRMLGTTTLGATPLFGRRLAPQEDKLDLTHIDHDDLGPLATSLGWLLGRAHRRGAKQLPPKAWSSAACALIVDHAITLAGIHEAVYLAICKEMRPSR
jgi:uncharacterized protein (DUF2252 family)